MEAAAHLHSGVFASCFKLVLDQNYLCEPAWPSLNYWSDPYDQAVRGHVMQINLFARSTYGSSIVLDAPSSDSTSRTTVRSSTAEQLVQRQAAAGSAEQPVSLYYWQLHVLNSLVRKVDILLSSLAHV